MADAWRSSTLQPISPTEPLPEKGNQGALSSLRFDVNFVDAEECAATRRGEDDTRTKNMLHLFQPPSWTQVSFRLALGSVLMLVLTVIKPRAGGREDKKESL